MRINADIFPYNGFVCESASSTLIMIYVSHSCLVGWAMQLLANNAIAFNICSCFCQIGSMLTIPTFAPRIVVFAYSANQCLLCLLSFTPIFTQKLLSLISCSCLHRSQFHSIPLNIWRATQWFTQTQTIWQNVLCRLRYTQFKIDKGHVTCHVIFCIKEMFLNVPCFTKDIYIWICVKLFNI